MIYCICDAKHGFIQNEDMIIYNNVDINPVGGECKESRKKNYFWVKNFRKSLVLWKKAVPLHPLPNNGAQDKRSLKRLHKQTE